MQSDVLKRLRSYQMRAVEDLRETVRRGNRSVVVNAPTGAGKTVIACALIHLCRTKDRKAVFIAPRRELIKQASAHLAEWDVLHGVILAGWESAANQDAPVQVCSKDTLGSRAIRRGTIALPPTDLLIVDECHTTAMAPEARKLIARFRRENPQCVVVGLSATPGRADGKGLGDVFDAMVNVASYEELIEAGYLVPTRCFSPTTVDMRGVKSKEWDHQADVRMRNAKLVGDVVEHWKRLAEGRPTVVFCTTIAHSLFLRDAFAAAGIRAAHIDQSTDLSERDQVLDDLDKGLLNVVTNVNVLTLGWDQPRVSCVVLACPTRSIVKYRQAAGRALRPHPGKTECLLIDHAGAVLMHGFPDEDMEWPLEKSINIDKLHAKRRLEGKIREPLVCPICGCTYHGRRDCPNCGYKNAVRGRDVAVKHGLLHEVKREKKQWRIGEAPFDVKRKFWHRCLAVMAARGQTVAAAAAMYAKQVGEPPWRTGMKGLPDPGSPDWQRPAAAVYPQFCRTAWAARSITN